MLDLLPFIPGSINNTLESIPFFLPEIYLLVLFFLVLVSVLLFGRFSVFLCCFFAFGDMLLLNRIAINFKLIIDALAAIIILYFEWDNRLKAHLKGLSDLYSIAIGSVLGLHLMAMAVNLLSIYLAIEMVSIASYLMVAYRSENNFSAEAGMKYVLFGAASSAIMLYGISLLYGFGGSLNLFSGNLLPGLMQANPLAVAFALALVLIGIGFKLSFVPVHFWVPDVYEGAPTPVT